ncbi:MAG: metallophosphoesterase [Puniceicoccales bacterium]|nr:metallophosphoesterase [Puniceicoccales bacterium]
MSDEHKVFYSAPDSLSTGSLLAIRQVNSGARDAKPVLSLVHITDVHIRAEYDAPERFRAMLRHIRLTNPDVELFLNSGDTIFPPYNEQPAHEVAEARWRLWQECLADTLAGITLRNCLGEGDLYASADGTDAAQIRPYALRQLGMESAYYSFSRKGWHFCVLDSNHAGDGVLGPRQMAWLKSELEHNRHRPVLVLSHCPIAAFCTVPARTHFHRDSEEILALFNANPNVKLCLSGHTHLLDRVWYNGVKFCCNGAVSGHWWESGDDGRSACRQTPPGYALVDLYANGSTRCEYVPFPVGLCPDNAF